MDFDNSIEKTLNEIQKVMNTNSIIGKPIVTKDKTVIPISKTALGFGLGVADNSGKSQTDLCAAGGGGSIDPVALLIVYDDISGPQGVELVRVDNQDTSLDNLLMGIGKTIFGLIDDSKVQPAKDDSKDSNVDKIKTKIKHNENK